jgi:cell fate regulator YaaT (PSP1 superfamily)
MSGIHDYLLSYGSLGDFGRFRPLHALTLERGDLAVVRSHRGLELATVLCPATAGHAHFLPNTTLGQLLRVAEPGDRTTAEEMSRRGRQLFEAGRELTAKLGLPLEVIDVEVLLDGTQAIVQYLQWQSCDPRPFVSRLSTQFEVQIALHELALTTPADEAEEVPGCSRPGCGRTAGGCSSCASGGCTSCANDTGPAVQEYFARLRDSMHEPSRTPLL